MFYVVQYLYIWIQDLAAINRQLPDVFFVCVAANQAQRRNDHDQ
jgi:hypothetical protein